MFLIQSLPRSGTHMLRTSLNSHGELWCYHEIFNPDIKTFRGRHLPPNGVKAVDAVLEHCRRQSRVTGFVVHAMTGLEEDETGPGLDTKFRSEPAVRAGRGLWTAIPQGTPVITLQRENLLARYVSRQVAFHRTIWNVRRGRRIPALLKVEINCADMLVDFVRTESLINVAKRRFPDALYVTYEQLLENWTVTLASIQAHIRVTPRHLVPDTEKLGRTLADTIVNLDEVCTALSGTRYEGFLVDIAKHQCGAATVPSPPLNTIDASRQRE